VCVRAIERYALLSEGRAGGRAEESLPTEWVVVRPYGGTATRPAPARWLCAPWFLVCDQPDQGHGRWNVVPVSAALRRPSLGGGGAGEGGGLFPGVGVGVGPGRGEPMMSAAAAAAGPGRGRALGGPGPEPEPELEAGEIGAAGGGHGDEPGLVDWAPSQSGGPRGEPGRARADRSRLPGPLPAARRRGGPGRAPSRDLSLLGLTWGHGGRGLSRPRLQARTALGGDQGGGLGMASERVATGGLGRLGGPSKGQLSLLL
jgi:hypothetical protein